jgi:calcineurin-like phosphoesterase family protein
MTNIFFTGCTHFGHKNIINLAGRPFVDVDEMNEELVRRWNAVVAPHDKVYHLGDVAWDKRGLDFLKRLKGSIVILPGNHDSASDLARYYREGDGRIIIGESIEQMHDHLIVMCHYPIEDWNGRWRGSIHLHCHTHSKQLRNPNIPWVNESALSMEEGDTPHFTLPSRYPPELTCNRFCVGVDSTAFAPISLDEILMESRK